MTVDAATMTMSPPARVDDYATFLAAGSAGDYAKKYGLESFPFVQKLFQNPAYTTFWSEQAVDKWFKDKPLTVPTMLVVGQWDQEDSYGAPAVYKALEPKDTNNDKLSLVIGPWRHSGVNYMQTELGPYKLPGDIALDFRKRYMKPFLDHYLKGGPDPKIASAITYATGVNQWNDPRRGRSARRPALPAGRRIARLDQTAERCARRLRLRSRQARALHAAPRPHA